MPAVGWKGSVDSTGTGELLCYFVRVRPAVYLFSVLIGNACSLRLEYRARSIPTGFTDFPRLKPTVNTYEAAFGSPVARSLTTQSKNEVSGPAGWSETRTL